MKSFGGLFDRIVSVGNLEQAMVCAARGKSHRQPVARFLQDAPTQLAGLHEELSARAYVPRPFVQFRIRDPKPRTISCADFRDRVVHHAICDVAGPLLDRRFIADSYACRIGKGSHRAVARAQQFSRRFAWCWKADIRKYYDSVDHRVLLDLLTRTFREEKLIELLETIVRHPFPGQAPGKGLPIGALTSQWFANLVLDQLDHLLKDRLGAPGYVRYMDDFVVWAASKEELFEIWTEVRAFLDRRLRLELKQPACRVVPVVEGLPFLGFRVFPRMLRLQRRRRQRMLRLIRNREREYAAGLIPPESLVRSVGASFGIVRCFGLRGPAGDLPEA